MFLFLPRGIDEFAAAMSADVVKCAKLPVVAAHYDYAFACYVDGCIAAGGQQVGFSCNTGPLIEKNFLPLPGEPRGLDVKIVM